MSGGIAYIYDLWGVFPPKCNMESVKLDKISEVEDLMFLKEILEEFVEETGSKVGKKILEDWPMSSTNFIKVFPNEYRKVLEEKKKANLSTQVSLTGHDVSSTSQKNVSFDLHDALLEASEKFEEAVKLKPAISSSKISESNESVEDIEDTIRNLDKLKGFHKYQRTTKQYRKVEERLKDWKEIHNHIGIRKGLKKQAARCMDCGIPFCQSKDGCPLGNIIPKWNDLVFQGNWKEALYQLLQTNNFPEFTGRVCPAPCEGACVNGINELPVTIKNIECAIIDKGFEEGWMQPIVPKKRTGKRIAIIGSGPAGLAAAHQLNRVGHLVTVFERNNAIGGLLRYGIPTMKLSKDVVQRRVDLMNEEGVEFRTNSEVGKNLNVNDLVKIYDSLLLTTGATWPRDLNIPGRQLNGIYFAMSFLQGWQEQQSKVDNKNKKKRVDENLVELAKGKRVLVIGGGDTGCDCIGTSIRQGAKSVTSFEILPPPPAKRADDNRWPTWPKVFKLDYGHEECLSVYDKDPRIYEISSKEFIDDGNGNVKGVRTVRIKWVKDEEGRWKLEEVPGSEEIFECELVLLAMGFLGPEENIIKQLNLEKDPRSNVKTPVGKYDTSLPNIYAAGGNLNITKKNS
jgi:glutamate synthase (NADH)